MKAGIIFRKCLGGAGAVGAGHGGCRQRVKPLNRFAVAGTLVASFLSMATQPQNLSEFERTLSALVGVSLTCLGLRSSTIPAVRALSGLVGAGLLVRAATGRCAVKAALLAPLSPRASMYSARVDEALEGTFPASDPPASRLPDEPPRNAEAKWAAARAAEKTSQDQDPDPKSDKNR
jgi:Protein of unknown function (DUF2892)